MTESAPLILTLGLAPTDQARFDQLRSAHFPPERNFIAAHITLFHHLPANDIGALSATLAKTAAAAAPFAIAVTGLRPLGGGVAFVLESAALARLRSGLATEWSAVLTAQDRQGFRPHITIQNKVDPVTAHRLFTQLSAAFTRFEIEATSLLLWHYCGGPWEKAGTFPFTNFRGGEVGAARQD